MKDIKRVFMYHGAEHKTIFCYEKGLAADGGKRSYTAPLSPEVRNLVYDTYDT